MNLGIFNIDDTLTWTVVTHAAATGALTDADAVPDYRVYEDETGTAILTGSMAKLDDANTTGHYSEQITLSAANGFELGKSYNIYVTAAVSSVTGGKTFHFQMRNFQTEAAAALTAYDPPTRTEATSDKAEILAVLQGLVLESGTIGATGNDTTHVHLAGLGYGDDEINNYMLVIYDVSNTEYHSRWVEGWADTGDLATVATLPFTPEASTDLFWLLPVRQDVTGGSGLDAAGVRAAVGLASANLDTQLAPIGASVIRSGTAQAADTTTVTLDSGAAFADNVLAGSLIVVDDDGLGYAQARAIASNVGATDVVTLDKPITEPTGTVTFTIFATAPASTALDTQLADIQTAVETDIPATIATAQADLDTLTGVDGAVIASGTQTFNMTGNITGNLSGSVGSVTGAVGSVTGSVGSVTGNVGGNVAGSVASVTGAVGSVTGNVGGNVVGSVGSVTTVSDKTGYRLSSTGVDDILRTALTEGYAADGATFTLEQAAYMIFAILAERVKSGTTLTAKKLDGSTTAMTFTLDDADNPATQTRSG